MSDKIVNHFVLADGSTARYDYDGLENAPDLDVLENGANVRIQDTTTSGGSHRYEISARAGYKWKVTNNSSTTITVNVGNSETEIAYGNLYATHSIEFEPNIDVTYFRYWVGAATIDISIEISSFVSEEFETVENSIHELERETAHGNVPIVAETFSYGWSWYWASGSNVFPWHDTSIKAVSNTDKMFFPKGTVVTASDGYQYKIHLYDSENNREHTELYYWRTGKLEIDDDYFAFVSFRKSDGADVGFNDIVAHVSIEFPLAYYVKENADNISALMGNEYSLFELPDYWETYLETKYVDIQEKDRTVGNHGDSFVFITDCHYSDNQMNGIKAIKKIKENTNVSRVINGGDYINDRTSVAQAIAELNVWAEYARRLNMICMRGNHDMNNNNGSTYEITYGDFYGTLIKPTENLYVNNGMIYGYEDNNNQKIRYIYLDTNAPDTAYIDSTQIEWLKATIQELETGWTVVVFAHQFYASDGTFPALDSNGTAITTALNSIYNTVDATIAGVIVGHSHTDYVDTTSYDYPIIVVTCDARQQSGGNTNRIVGTVSEQAFDVIHIDTNVNKFYCTRIGYGSDREISY